MPSGRENKVASPWKKRKRRVSVGNLEEAAVRRKTGPQRQKKALGTSEDARKRKEDQLWTNFLSDVGPKSKVSPSPHSSK